MRKVSFKSIGDSYSEYVLSKTIKFKDERYTTELQVKDYIKEEFMDIKINIKQYRDQKVVYSLTSTKEPRNILGANCIKLIETTFHLYLDMKKSLISKEMEEWNGSIE